METQFDKKSVNSDQLRPDEAVVELTFRTYTRPERPRASLTPATRRRVHGLRHLELLGMI